jgi:hypothetical protein
MCSQCMLSVGSRSGHVMKTLPLRSHPYSPMRMETVLLLTVISLANQSLLISLARSWIFLQFQACVTMVSSGGFVNSSSAMTYNFGSIDEGNENSACTVGIDIDPQSLFSHAHHPKCSSYYTKALHRQHSKSSLFRDFSPELGRAYLVSSPGY